MKRDRTVYYTDEAHDDFARNSIRAKPVGPDFRYINRNLLWRLCAWIFYRLIATPVAWITCHVVYGCRIRDRKALRALRKLKTGFYLYGNHTQAAFDAFLPTLLTFPRRCYIITGPDAVSVPGLGQAVRMLGALPLPDGTEGVPNFTDAVRKRVQSRCAVCIYPEAHIWPFHSGLRNFSAGSFIYPVREGVPAAAFTVEYRQRKLFPKLPPRTEVHVSMPFCPDAALPERAARKALRDQVYDFMRGHLCDGRNYAYIRYVKRDPDAVPSDSGEEA